MCAALARLRGSTDKLKERTHTRQRHGSKCTHIQMHTHVCTHTHACAHTHTHTHLFLRSISILKFGNKSAVAFHLSRFHSSSTLPTSLYRSPSLWFSWFPSYLHTFPPPQSCFIPSFPFCICLAFPSPPPPPPPPPSVLLPLPPHQLSFLSFVLASRHLCLADWPAGPTEHRSH